MTRTVFDYDVAAVAAGLLGKADVGHTHTAAQVLGLAAIASSGSASDLAAGTLPDARLAPRLGTLAASITDWNAATSNGWFVGNSASNGPSGGLLMGYVLNQGSTWVVQYVRGYAQALGGAIGCWRRQRRDGVWGSWVETPQTPQRSLRRSARWRPRTRTPSRSAAGTIAGITDLAIADGGTGASTAAGARANLGLAPISASGSASDLSTGTLPDARLPARLATVAATVTDWNAATSNGWYVGNNASNGPSGGLIMGYVENQGSTWIVQQVRGFAQALGGNIGCWRRQQRDGVWGAWISTPETASEIATLLGSMATQNADAVAIGAGTIAGITDLAIADGGTGASTAAGARANLGLAPVSTSGSASDLYAGTLPDARLPARLGTVAATVTDWNAATSNGWYVGTNASNGPSGGLIMGYVENQGSTWIVQQVRGFAQALGGNIGCWRRQQRDGVWGAWVSTPESASEIATLLGSMAVQDADAVAIGGGTIAGITDLAIADGGTGASTAAGARANLGLAPISASGSASDL